MINKENKKVEHVLKQFPTLRTHIEKIIKENATDAFCIHCKNLEIVNRIETLFEELLNLPKKRTCDSLIVCLRQYKLNEQGTIQPYLDVSCYMPKKDELRSLQETNSYYDVRFLDWNDLIDAPLLPNRLNPFLHPYDILTAILEEMTWFGYSYEEVCSRQRDVKRQEPNHCTVKNGAKKVLVEEFVSTIENQETNCSNDLTRYELQTQCNLQNKYEFTITNMRYLRYFKR